MIPSTAPMAAPVIKPNMVVLVIDGVPLTNKKPATAIHKVQRTMRMFMVYSQNGNALPLSPLAEGLQQRRVTLQSGKSSITVSGAPESPFFNNVPCRSPNGATEASRMKSSKPGAGKFTRARDPGFSSPQGEGRSLGPPWIVGENSPLHSLTPGPNGVLSVIA